jgi:hypothetical protein
MSPLFTVVLMLFVVACVPMKATWLEPQTSEGMVVRHDCHGNVGPPDTIVVERENIKIRVMTTVQENEHRMALTIQLQMPEGVAVTMPFRTLIVTVPNGQEATEPSRLTRYAWKPHYESKEISGEEGRALIGGDYVYHLSFNVSLTAAESIRIQLPSLFVNQKEERFSSVQYSLRTGWYIYPINC